MLPAMTMTASLPHVNVETTGAWTTVSHFAGDPNANSLLTTLPRSKRQKAFRVGALVVVLFVLVFLSAMDTCSQLFKTRIARRHESVVRRLAAGGEEEEGGAFLKHILLECVGGLEELEGTADADTVPEGALAFPQTSARQEFHYPGSAGFLPGESHAVSQAPTPTHERHEIVPQPSSGIRILAWPPSGRDTGVFSSDQRHSSQSELLESTPSALPHGSPSTEPFMPKYWRPFLETSTDVSTPQHPEQPSPLNTKTREERSSSPSTCDDSTESKRQKVAPTQSPEGSLIDFTKLSTVRRSAFTVVTKPQRHQPLPFPAYPIMKTRTREERSSSPSTCDDSTESKRQKVSPTQSPEGSLIDFTKLSTVRRSAFTVVTKPQHHQPLPFPAYPIMPSAMSHSAWTHFPERAFPIPEQHHQPPWLYPSGLIMPSAMSHSAQIYFPGHASHTTSQETSFSSLPRLQQPARNAPAGSNLTALVAPSTSVSQLKTSFSLPPPAPPMPPTTHLYYRLPVVQPGAVFRSFNTTSAFAHRRRKNTLEFFPIIHRLLTQPSINGSEAESLVSACEKLACHLYGYHTCPFSHYRPAIAARALARRYVYVEALFCAIQVLGSAMRAECWWRQLMQLVPTDFVAPTGSRNSAGTVLSERLSSALSLLKSGIRPSLEETVALKRELFKNQPVQLGLSEVQWDDWRKDDDSDAGSSVS